MSNIKSLLVSRTYFSFLTASWMVCSLFDFSFWRSTSLTGVSLSSFQICRQRGSLLRNACSKEETYITEEEGGTTVNDCIHSLPVFLCPLHLSFQHGTALVLLHLPRLQTHPEWRAHPLVTLVLTLLLLYSIWHYSHNTPVLSSHHVFPSAFNCTVKRVVDHIHNNANHWTNTVFLIY